MTNDEVIKIAGKIYDEGGKAEEAANILIDKAKNKWLEHTRINKENKNYKKQINTVSKKAIKSSKELLIDNKLEDGTELKKRRKLDDDITCLVIYLKIK